MRMPMPRPRRSTPICAAAAMRLLKACIGGSRTRDDIIKIVSDAGSARPRRRRLSHRAQMVAGSRRTGAAPVRGQRRRGRAGHVQGPLLSRAGSAPLHRGHADRGLGRRGGRHLSLYPRRISGTAASARSRRSPRSRKPACRSTAKSICAAAPALTSAAKNRR